MTRSALARASSCWPSCGRTRTRGRRRRGSRTRCSRRSRRAAGWASSTRARATCVADAVLTEELAALRVRRGGGRDRGAHAHRHAADLPRSAPTRRRRAGSRRRSAASGSARWRSPSRTRGPTWRRCAPAPCGSTAAGSSPAPRRTSPTACGRTSTSPRCGPAGRATRGLSFLVLERGEGITARRAAQARLARVRHRGARVRRGVRARGAPARRGGPRLLPDHGQLPVGAARDGARRGRRDAAHARARRRRAGRARAGDAPPRGRARDARGGGHRAHLPRAAPLPGRRGRRARGHDGQARDPARELRPAGRVPAPDRPRPASSSARPATPASARSAAAPTRSCARSSPGPKGVDLRAARNHRKGVVTRPLRSAARWESCAMPGVIAHNLFHRVGEPRTGVDVLRDVSLEAPAGKRHRRRRPVGRGQDLAAAPARRPRPPRPAARSCSTGARCAASTSSS